MTFQAKLITLASFVIIFLLLVACNAQPVPSGEAANTAKLSAVALTDNQKVKVIATTNIVADLVHNVGGDHITLTTLLPIGADPHTFTPAPQDAAAVADADVVFLNGLGLEIFLAELIENAGGNAAAVALSTNVPTRLFAESLDDDQDQLGIDPHIWMTPGNAIIMVQNIQQALSQLDPNNATVYMNNAEAYIVKLKALDSWVQTQLESIPAEKRKLVTDHDAFGYYADQYGLTVVGTVIPNFSTNAEPSAQELAALQQAIETFDTNAIFVGTTVNPVLAQRMATDTGINLVPLYTGSLGQAGSGVESYEDFIRYNTEAIVAALAE